MRAVVRGVLAWVTGAVVAVGVGMLALSRIGYGFTVDSVQPLGSGTPGGPSASAPPPSPSSAPPPRSSAPSRRPHRSPKAEPSRARATHRASPSPVSRERLLSSPGGTAIVRCTRSAAYLVSWSPEQGYHVDDVRRGPAPEVSVEFEGRERHVMLRAWCRGDVPQSRASYEHRDDD